MFVKSIKCSVKFSNYGHDDSQFQANVIIAQTWSPLPRDYVWQGKISNFTFNASEKTFYFNILVYKWISTPKIMGDFPLLWETNLSIKYIWNSSARKHLKIDVIKLTWIAAWKLDSAPLHSIAWSAGPKLSKIFMAKSRLSLVESTLIMYSAPSSLASFKRPSLMSESNYNSNIWCKNDVTQWQVTNKMLNIFLRLKIRCTNSWMVSIYSCRQL